MSEVPKPLALEDIVPGGIKSTDHWHITINDSTCSRCRQKVDDDEVPLMLFRGEMSSAMLIYCRACLVPAKELGDGDEPRAQ